MLVSENNLILCLISTQKLQVICFYITGHLNIVFPIEYQKEILRYLYNHQVRIL